MKRILYMFAALPVGGAERLLVETLRKLDRAKFDPAVCVLSQKGPIGAEIEKMGVPVIPLGRMKTRRFDLTLVFRLSRLLKEGRFHILHAHLYHASLYGRLAARLVPAPLRPGVVVTFHNIYPKPRPRRHLINRRLASWTDAVIAVSEDVRESILKHDRIPADIVKVVENGIDFEPYEHLLSQDAARSALGIPPAIPVIGCVARLTEQKGHVHLLRAFSEIRGRRPHARLVLAGDGELRSRLTDEAKRMGILDAVSFLGTRTDIPRILAALDVFVLPSLWEGLGLAAVEAMAAGIPVVATRVTGLRHLIASDKVGILVPPADPMALARAVEMLLDDRGRSKAISAEAGRYARETYSIESHVRRLETLYEEIAMSSFPRKRESRTSILQHWIPAFAGMTITRPATFLLQLVFKALYIARPLPAPPDFQTFSPSSILLFSTAGIGDTLSDTPAIRAVKERFPAARVGVVVHEKRKGILEANPSIDLVIPHRKGPIAFFSTLKQIRGLRPDIAVVLRANDPDIWPLAYLSGARAVVSRADATVFPFLVNCPVRVESREDMPGVLQTLAIVNRIGAETGNVRMNYTVNVDERRDMERQILSAGPPVSRVAVQIHSSPRLAFRDWPSKSFVEFCRTILQEFPVRIFLTGGPDDISKAVNIHTELSRLGHESRVTNFAGRLSLRRTAALLEQCAFFVTTDTGLMHLGFALNVPTLALLHPYNARRVGPYGYANLHHALVMAGPEKDERGKLRSLSDLSPESAAEAFRKMYGDVV